MAVASAAQRSTCLKPMAEDDATAEPPNGTKDPAHAEWVKRLAGFVHALNPSMRLSITSADADLQSGRSGKAPAGMLRGTGVKP